MFNFMKNEEIWTKYILDNDGFEKSILIKETIIIAKQNQYIFENWCFPHQTPQELMLYLWKYGKVIYLRIGKDLHFFPFESDKEFLTKQNIHLASLSIKEHFNKRIITNEFLTKEQLKGFPFIFINSLQTAPEKSQDILFRELKSVFNTNIANRKNKGKSFIVFVPKGSKHQEAIYRHHTMPDASPFIFIETSSGGKNNLSPNQFQNMTTDSTDLYQSLKSESVDIMTLMKILNGVPSNMSFTKNSAQETDEQTQSQKTETSFILKSEFDEMNRGLMRLRAIHGNKISVLLKRSIFMYVKEAFISNTIESSEPEKIESTESKDSNNKIMEFLKKLLPKNKIDDKGENNV